MEQMALEGDKVTVVQACKWSGMARRSYYYQTKQSKPKLNDVLVQRIKRFIDAFPYAGYRTVAALLGLNKNTVQRIFQLKGWQVRKRKSGMRPRAQAMPSVSTRPDERWSTDMARVWCGPQARWACLTLVMDCHTRELLGWRLSRQGNAKAAEATLEEALINRFGCLVPLKEPLKLRSDNGLVFSSRRYTQTVYRYGIEQEFIKPHTPQQNGMVERLIRTVKEQCIHLHSFNSIEQARETLSKWFKFYNEQRPHQALKMKTPKQAYELHQQVA